MPHLSINVTKWYHFLIASLPLIAFVGTMVLWVDTRYMHKEISDTRWNDLQIKITTAQLRDYHRMIRDGVVPSADEKIQFKVDTDQLELLMEERNRLMGIGPDK